MRLTGQRRCTHDGPGFELIEPRRQARAAIAKRCQLPKCQPAQACIQMRHAGSLVASELGTDCFTEYGLVNLSAGVHAVRTQMRTAQRDLHACPVGTDE